MFIIGVANSKNIIKKIQIKAARKELICHDIFEKMVIYTNGNVGLCCIDANGFYDIGNVIDNDPIEIYNSQIFKHHRNLMKEGKFLNLNIVEIAQFLVQKV